MAFKITLASVVAIAICFAFNLTLASADGPDLIASPEVQVNTISGSGVAGIADGSPREAEFIAPFGLVYDDAGRLYVSDAGGQRIRVVEKDGSTHTLAGSGKVIASGLWVEGGYRDGLGPQARFNRPAGLAIGRDKALYVADTNNHCIRRIDASGAVSTFAGRAGVAGHDDGFRTTATFERPTGMASDDAGNLYVADFFAIRIISPAGIVATLPHFGNAAFGISVVNTASGVVIFVADESGLARRMPDGSIERYAASNAHVDSKDLQGEQLLGHPFGIAAFDDHSIAFTDVRSNTVRYLNWAAGALQTLGGVPIEDGEASSGGYRDGSGTDSRFDVPLGIVARSDGTLVVADGGNKRLRKITKFDRSHDAVPGTSFPSNLEQSGYRVAFVGNSFVGEYTRWSDSIEGIVENSLSSAAGTARIRIEPYVLPQSAFGAEEQYIELLARGGVADFYVLNINPGTLSGAAELGNSQLEASPHTWQPLVTSTLRKLNHTLTGLHAGLLVYTTPFGENVSPLETAWPQLFSSEGQTTPDARLGAELNAAVRASGVDMLDLWSVFGAEVRSPNHEPLFGTTDVHLSYHGRAIVAREIAKWFKQRQPWGRASTVIR